MSYKRDRKGITTAQAKQHGVHASNYM